MRVRLALIALAACALVASGSALAAKPLTQKQYTELRLKQALTTWAKKNVPGLSIVKVTCVLPKNGTVVKCVANGAATRAHELVVFKVSETLNAVGTMSWRITSSACSDSKTHAKISCSG